jgi:hypothetical protein
MPDYLCEDHKMCFICPVCGYPGLEEQPRGDLTGGSYEICPSCGIQFGYSDEAGGDEEARKELYKQWRQKWIEGGMIWNEGRSKPPPDWNPREQLRRVILTS